MLLCLLLGPFENPVTANRPVEVVLRGEDHTDLLQRSLGPHGGLPCCPCSGCQGLQPKGKGHFRFPKVLLSFPNGLLFLALSGVDAFKPTIASQRRLLDHPEGSDVHRYQSRRYVVVGANINANPSRPTVWKDGFRGCNLTCAAQLGGRGVAKEDGASRVDRPLVLEPLFSYPEEFFLTLHVQRHAGVVASVDEANVVENELGGQRVKPHEIVQHPPLGLP